jgi:hypothetical protein
MNDFFKEFDAASAQFHFSQHQAHHDAHKRAHQQAHQKAHNNAFGFDFSSLFDDDIFDMDANHAGESHSEFTEVFEGSGNNNIHVHRSTVVKTSQQTCRTVTRREGKTVSTITECT